MEAHQSDQSPPNYNEDSILKGSAVGAEETSEKSFILYNEEAEQLLFNSAVPLEPSDVVKDRENRTRTMNTGSYKGKMGEIFGSSLILLNMGVVEKLTEAKLDEIICNNEEKQVLNAISEASAKSFEVFETSRLPFFETKRPCHPENHCLRGSQELHKFSIPRIYGVGENADERSALKRTFKKLHFENVTEVNAALKNPKS